MFNINSNQNIKLSRGDSVKFPLFINKGTLLSPVRYTFSDGIASIQTISDGLSATLVQATFKAKGLGAGTHTFTYVSASSSWQYDSQNVTLIDYGIILIGIPEDGNTIVVKQTSNDGCEVYFYLTQTNEPVERALLKKVYKTSGTIDTTIIGQSTVTTTKNNINENGDIVITLDSSDTTNFREGIYHYIIKAKLLDTDGSYITQTITNRHEFWLIDDDYNRGIN